MIETVAPPSDGLNRVAHYRARIELNSQDDPAADVLEMLGGYRPSVGRSRRGHLQLTLIVPADDLRQALKTSVAVVGWAIDLEVLELEVGFLTTTVRVDVDGTAWNDARSA